MLAEREKQSRIDHQFGISSYSLFYLPSQIGKPHGSGSACEFNRQMESFEQTEAAQLADKTSTLTTRHSRSALQDLQQIVIIGEILHHRVENDRIETGGLKPAQIL